MPRAISLTQSRTYPTSVEAAYDAVVPVPLTRIFDRWHGPLPPVTRVSDQSGGDWGSTLGATRVVSTADRGRMREELTAVQRPHHFNYHLTPLSGSLKQLLSGIDGEWSFEPVGTGVRITWAWTLHPKHALATPPVALITRLWPGYARHALANLEAVLVTDAAG